LGYPLPGCNPSFAVLLYLNLARAYFFLCSRRLPRGVFVMWAQPIFRTRFLSCVPDGEFLLSLLPFLFLEISPFLLKREGHRSPFIGMVFALFFSFFPLTPPLSGQTSDSFRKRGSPPLPPPPPMPLPLLPPCVFRLGILGIFFLTVPDRTKFFFVITFRMGDHFSPPCLHVAKFPFLQFLFAT